MDAKRVALIIGIAVLLPLFLGLFMDAVYPQPQYDKYCTFDAQPYMYPKEGINCTADSSPQYLECINDRGQPKYGYDSNNCQVYESCDYCSRDYNDAEQVYNRNLFLILAPIGLIIVIIGLYLAIEYIGAGLMFAGLITMFYATLRYFGNMSKILRAIIILVELIIVVWIGLKKIGKNEDKINSNRKKKK